MRLCPQTVLDKYLAITAIDCGVLVVTHVEKTNGWETRQNIAYSPRVKSLAGLPHEDRHGYCDAGFDEWYVLDAPTELGGRCDTNIFEAHLQPGGVWVFVGYYGFELHEPEMAVITDLFWKQMEWIRPESFIADGDSCLTFVTRDKGLHITVRNTLATHS